MTRSAGEWARPGLRGSTSDSRSSGWSPGRPPFTTDWPARPTQWALRILLSAAEAARVHHPQVAQRVVVLHRIGRIDQAERRRDITRHLPARARQPREAQA